MTDTQKKDENIAIKAMDLNESIHEKNGIKIQGGKTYTKVVHRIEAFRRTVGYDYGVETSIQMLNGGYVCNAVIKHKEGHIVGSGSSYTANLSKDKALEKMETTAIGRALASLGLGGDEYASIEEVNTHEERYQEPVKPTQTPAQKWLADASKTIKALKNPEEITQWVKDNPTPQLSTEQADWYNTEINKAIERTYQRPMAAE